MLRMNTSALLLLPAMLSAACLVSCSSPNFDNIPRNGYITHFEKNPANPPALASLWQAKGTSVPSSDSRPVYIKPVSLEHYQESAGAPRNSRSLAALRQYFDARLRARLAALDATDDGFHLVNAPGTGVYTVEVAILSSQPTKVKNNILSTAADRVVGSLAGSLMRDDEDTGSIAMGAQFRDPQGRLLAEAADFEAGEREESPEILSGIRLADFQRYGYQRQAINGWTEQIARLFTAENRPAPWFRLSADPQ